MKTKEFADSLEKNTDYVVMGLGATNEELNIAYLMRHWNGVPEPMPMRTPIMIEFRKDAINADEVKTFSYDDKYRKPTNEDYQCFMKLFRDYVNTPILDRMGDDGYWVVDYPAEVYSHNNYAGLKTIQHCFGGLANENI